MESVNTLRNADDQKLVLSLESTSGFPAALMAKQAWSAARLRFYPAELAGTRLPESDCVVVCRCNSTAAQACRRQGLKIPALPPGGYAIRFVKARNRRILLVAGGDLFGMLAGWADAQRRSELTARGLLCRGVDRTEIPAFPMRYYWTWDHSTNWVLDDPGNQATGCSNGYFKKPETFIEDYRRLVDHCVEMRFNGIVLWGFLRDAHGGEASAYAVARYAADRGVYLMPGVGTTGYGGVYYDGRHPCNIETFLSSRPELGNMDKGGVRSGSEMSPYHRDSQQWIVESMEWLLRNFPVGGLNLENMDFLVDHSPTAQRARAKIKTGEDAIFKDQFVAYKNALDVAHRLAPDNFNAYATYAGFSPKAVGPTSGGRAPTFARRMPSSAVAQWTLSGMVRQDPLPLRAWLENPRPPGLYANPQWPRGMRPPTPRSAGFMHQASQWCPTSRNACMISTFVEGAVRAHEEGFEGISIHGEVSSRVLSYNLNYLAMRHWTYHPKSTLEAFAQEELAGRVGDAKAAQAYMQALVELQAGKIDEAKKHLNAGAFNVGRGADPAGYPCARMWIGLRQWAAQNAFPYWGRGHLGFV